MVKDNCHVKHDGLYYLLKIDLAAEDGNMISFGVDTHRCINRVPSGFTAPTHCKISAILYIFIEIHTVDLINLGRTSSQM